MSEFIEELNKKKILSREDIYTLKKYIYKKNPNKTNCEKANILSEAIHTVLDTNLQGISDDAKNEIKQILLKNLLIENEEQILLSEVFEIYSSLCEENEFYYEELTNWINYHIEQKISCEDLRIYNKELNCSINSDYNLTINLVNAEQPISTPNYNKITTTQNFNLEAIELNPPLNSLSSSQSKIENVNNNYYIKKVNKIFKKTYIVPLLIILILSLSVSIINISNNKTKNEKSIAENSSNTDSSLDSSSSKNKTTKNNSKLSEEFRYMDINSSELKKFLNSKNSLLAEEPYFSTIISTAKEYDLNPLILFAITGQEQGFVPKNAKDAKKIANNPFNVYHSWKEYNTSIGDSCKIASVTIINICKDLPSNVDTFEWINKTYAEDKKWGKGVKSIFEELHKIIR